MGDHEQFWFTKDDTDGTVLESGMIREPLSMISTVILNGTSFDEVISIPDGNSQSMPTFVHMQRGIGIIGYELQGETWVVL